MAERPDREILGLPLRIVGGPGSVVSVLDPHHSALLAEDEDLESNSPRSVEPRLLDLPRSGVGDKRSPTAEVSYSRACRRWWIWWVLRAFVLISMSRAPVASISIASTSSWYSILFSLFINRRACSSNWSSVTFPRSIRVPISSPRPPNLRPPTYAPRRELAPLIGRNSALRRARPQRPSTRGDVA